MAFVEFGNAGSGHMSVKCPTTANALLQLNSNNKCYSFSFSFFKSGSKINKVLKGNNIESAIQFFGGGGIKYATNNGVK